MANKKKEEVVEQTTDEKVEAPMGDTIKVKLPKKPKQLGNQDKIAKVNLSKEETTEEVVEEQPKEEVNDKVIEEVQEKVEEEKVEDKKEETEQPVLEEVTEEKTDEAVEDEVKTVEETVKEAVEEAKETGQDLPENIQKVVDFMNETGGDLEDYVKLNQDYSKLDDVTLLREYYNQTKPHLSGEEISFLIEDSFSYDEEVDEALDVKRKKLAFKEQVANAKGQLDKLKSNYYAEIKSGVKLTPDQQKAIDFFNRYNNENKKSQEVAEKQHSVFLNQTDKVFNNNFKGFEFNVGEKKYRFNVNDVSKVKEQQSDINNFISQYVDKNNLMSNANGYHKSLFTAMNADAIANHFYQQGKADAVKETMAKAKNVDMSGRQSGSTTPTGGIQFKPVVGDSLSSLRVKIKK